MRRSPWIRRVGASLAVGALGLLFSAPAGASPTISWGPPAVIDTQFLTGISCPTVSLCVATDGSGNVVVSTNPAGGPSAWTTTRVDASTNTPGFAVLSAIACPTAGLCVATDGSGNVVVSTNPTGGPSAWKVLTVDGGENLTSISCPSASLCVAGDGGQNVVTSTDPAGGASAWTVAHVDDGTGAQCGKYGDGDECVLGLTGVACPSQSLCVAVDGEGNAITSTNPAGGATAWQTADIDGRLIGGADGLVGVTCPSASLCVTADDYGDHVITSTDPTGGSAAWSAVPVDFALQTVSCPMTSLCLAGGPENVVSEDPGGGPSAWTDTGIDPAGPISQATCPSPSLCLAVDSSGHVVVGELKSSSASPPPVLGGHPGGGSGAGRAPLRRRVDAALRAIVTPRRGSARIRALLNQDGYRFSFAAPAAGRLTVKWDVVHLSGHTAEQTRGNAKAVLIGRARATFRRVGRARLKLTLTRAGRGLLRHLGRAKVTATASFTPVSGPKRTVMKKFVIRR